MALLRSPLLIQLSTCVLISVSLLQAHAQKQRGQQSMSIAAVQKAAEALKVCNQPFCILFFADLHSAFVLLLRIGMLCCLQ